MINTLVIPSSNVRAQLYGKRKILKAVWDAMTKISFNVEPPSLAQAMCGSKCLNYECQMYREDGTGKCHLVFPVSVRMCNNEEVFTALCHCLGGHMDMKLIVGKTMIFRNLSPL